MTTSTRTYDSTIARIIAEEVHVNASQMIQELTQGDGYYEEDIMACISAPDYSEAPEGYSVERADHPASDGGPEWAWRHGVDAERGFDTEREAIIAAWEDAGDEPDDIEALQHWIISDWLADKLEQVGALVARDVLGFNVWGRAECGQGLEEDSDLNAVVRIIQNA